MERCTLSIKAEYEKMLCDLGTKEEIDAALLEGLTH